MTEEAYLLLTSYVVNAVWQVAALAVAAWLIARWVKPAGPELQHKIWVVTLILATLAPATPAIRSYLAHRVSTGPLSASDSAAAAQPPVSRLPLTESDLILRPAALRLIGGAYMMVLLFCILRLGRTLQRTRALVHNADAAAFEPDYEELWYGSKERFSIKSAVLRRSPNVSGPVTAGLGRPVLLLPADFLENHSQTEFLAAIAHECAHIQRDDFRKNALYEIVALFTVFHPATWLIKSQIAQTREMICDGMAAEKLADRRAYARLLVQLAGKMPARAAAVSPAMGMFDAGILEKRVMAITASLPRFGRIQRRLWGATAISLLAICAGGAGLMTRTVAAQTPSPSAAAPDLACSYYHDGVEYAGTCAYGKKGEPKYVCYMTSDSTKRQMQSACEWKLRRADEAK